MICSVMVRVTRVVCELQRSAGGLWLTKSIAFCFGGTWWELSELTPLGSVLVTIDVHRMEEVNVPQSGWGGRLVLSQQLKQMQRAERNSVPETRSEPRAASSYSRWQAVTVVPQYAPGHLHNYSRSDSGSVLYPWLSLCVFPRGRMLLWVRI